MPFLFVTILGHASTGQTTATLGRALGQELHDPLELAAPKPAVLAKIVALTGVSPALLTKAERFAATTREGDSIYICRMPMPDGDVAAATLFAVDRAGTFFGAAALDEAGKAIDEWRPLFRQFKFRPLPRLALAKPKSAIEAARKIATNSDDPNAKLTLALLRLIRHMQDQAALFNIPRPRSQKPERKLILQVRDAYRGVAELKDDLEPILGRQADKFAGLATKAAEISDKFLAALDEDDLATAAREGRALTRNCRSCHNMTGLKVEGKLKDVSRAKREALGIGDGYFIIGYDIRVAHADRKKAQRVLDSLRQAALLLDDCVSSKDSKSIR